MSAKLWLKVFFSTISLLSVLFYVFIIVAEAEYPLRISDSISFDEKLRFLKNSGRLSNADSVIMGSSMGLYNLNNELLEHESAEIGVIANISSWGLQTTQLPQLLQLIAENNAIKTVIYPTQVLDFAFDKSLQLDFDELNKYINKEFTLYLYNRVFLNAFNFLKALYNFKWYHQTENTYESLLFGKTGGIVYKIYGDNIDRERWDDTRVFGLNKKNFAALVQIAQSLNARQVRFVVVITPVRQVLLDNNPPMMEQYQRFTKIMQDQAKRDGFNLINLHEALALDDKYFADSSHLNAEGAAIAARKVAQFIDEL